MVFGDWRRDLMFPFDWTNDKTRERLLAYPFEDFFVVEVVSPQEKILRQDSFKTKDLAVKFALDFMKKH